MFSIHLRDASNVFNTLHRDEVCPSCLDVSEQKAVLFQCSHDGRRYFFGMLCLGIIILSSLAVMTVIAFEQRAASPSVLRHLLEMGILALCGYGANSLIRAILIGHPSYLFKDHEGRVHFERAYPVSIEPTCVRDRSTLAHGPVIVLRCGILGWSGPVTLSGSKASPHQRVRLTTTPEGRPHFTFETKAVRYVGVSVDTLLRLADPNADHDAERCAHAALSYLETVRANDELRSQRAVLLDAVKESLRLTTHSGPGSFLEECSELLVRALYATLTASELEAYASSIAHGPGTDAAALRERLLRSTSHEDGADMADAEPATV